jgi:aquaporin Z
MKDLFKKAIAECLGTFTLVFVACGVAALTKGDLVPTALAFGLVIVAMAYSIGRISGCHINPAVSLGVFLSKKMSLTDFLVYVGSQIVGGFLGGLAIFGFAKMAGLELQGDACNLVVNFDGAGLTAGTIFSSLLVEIVLTFLFVYVILNVTDEKNNGVGKKAGLLIGLTLTLVHLVGINLTGTSVNPARSLATALNALIFNGTTDAIGQVWIFFVGPLLGGALAALVFKALHSEAK